MKTPEEWETILLNHEFAHSEEYPDRVSLIKALQSESWNDAIEALIEQLSPQYKKWTEEKPEKDRICVGCIALAYKHAGSLANSLKKPIERCEELRER